MLATIDSANGPSSTFRPDDTISTSCSTLPSSVPARRAAERVRQAHALVERRGRLLMTRLGGPLLAGLIRHVGLWGNVAAVGNAAFAISLPDDLILSARLARGDTVVGRVRRDEEGLTFGKKRRRKPKEA